METKGVTLLTHIWVDLSFTTCSSLWLTSAFWGPFKQSKGGGVIIRLDYQEENVNLPVYGLGSRAEGTVRRGGEVWIPNFCSICRLARRSVEIAGSGSASVNLCLDSTRL